MPDVPPDQFVPIAAEHSAVIAGEEIDIVAAAANFRILPPRNGCGQSEPGVIVVCGPRPAEEYRIDPSAAAPRPTAMEEIGEKLRPRIGPAEVGIVPMTGAAGSGGAGVEVRMRF